MFTVILWTGYYISQSVKSQLYQSVTINVIIHNEVRQPECQMEHPVEAVSGQTTSNRRGTEIMEFLSQSIYFLGISVCIKILKISQLHEPPHKYSPFFASVLCISKLVAIKVF